MYNFPIGVIVESFTGKTEDCIKKAAAIGAQGIQMYMTAYGLAENHVDNMTTERQKMLLDMVKSEGMVFSAICGDLGGDAGMRGGFQNPEANPLKIEKSKKIMEFAKEFGTDVVTTHIGKVPEDPTCDTYKIIQEACFQLAEFADSMGSHFAIETGPEPSARLGDFLDSLNSTGVAVNFDPANLVMITGDDPVQAVYNLKDYIVHTHAKDGIKFGESNPEEIYRMVFSENVVKNYKEMPLGQGTVPYPEYLAALDDIGYKGFLTIEREVGDDPAGDIKTAYDFLCGIIGK